MSSADWMVGEPRPAPGGERWVCITVAGVCEDGQTRMHTCSFPPNQVRSRLDTCVDYAVRWLRHAGVRQGNPVVSPIPKADE